MNSRILLAVLALSIAVHFMPLARPGFQPDDFAFLQRARVEPAWSFVDASLSQPTRPLGFLLFTLLPQFLGLSEPSQLIVLISTTTLLTALVYILLADLLPPAAANLATLAFVVWPVKHEIYSSQLFGVHNLVAAMVVGSALLYRRWTRTSEPLALALAAVCYGVSVFTYEIGYLAPLVFLLMGSPGRSRPYGIVLFLVPAALYWVLRIAQTGDPIGGGLYPISLSVLLDNLLTSLPSNLFGFQAGRNVGYGLWGVLSGPIWFQLWCTVSAVILGFFSARWIGEELAAPGAPDRWRARCGGGLLAAAVLAAPAAAVLVESRGSVLAAIGMGVVVAAVAIRLKPLVGSAVVVVLLLSTQGLALRQAEVSRLQAAVYTEVKQHREEIRSAAAVVIDIASLADRLSYTWGEKKVNVLRAYWGLHAFSGWGFEAMVGDVLYGRAPGRIPEVRTCSGQLLVSETRVLCDRDYADQKPFGVDKMGSVVVDFKAMPLP